MLVLSRHVRQAIVIGDPAVPEEAIEVVVLSVSEDQVRLGIQAPRATNVRRSEIPRQEREAQTAP